MSKNANAGLTCPSSRPSGGAEMAAYQSLSFWSLKKEVSEKLLIGCCFFNFFHLANCWWLDRLDLPYWLVLTSKP
ncbi:MAG: hypothetical protein KGI54_18960, partial [Pseudomonadota bacterium]|nr:hypothetical protein [Pseudomonadota bacterium]